MSRRPWTYPELAELRRLCAAGLTTAAVGDRLGRTPAAVRVARWGLGLRAQASKGAHDAAVRRGVRAGWFDWEIALEIGRSETMVRKVRARLGLPPASASQSGRAKARGAVA